MDSTVDDDALLTAAAQGNEDAFATFYRRWLPVVLSFHRRRTANPEVAFDLTAETFATVVANLGAFNPDRGEAASWLLTIAAHKLRDSVRRARVEQSARQRLALEPILLEDDDLARVEELSAAGDDCHLDGLLEHLPADQRVAIRARIIDEQPYPTIASELDCSEAVVRQRVHRGLARLRDHLGDRP